MSPASADRRSVVVLTGLSGAGKQLAARYFEDNKWRVIDNLPPELLPAVIESADSAPLCVVIDVRAGRIEALCPVLDALSDRGEDPVLLFLDASDEELVRRFKETRRPHPLFDRAGAILPAIVAERVMLQTLRERADLIIDTSDLDPMDFRSRLKEAFPSRDGFHQQPLTVTVVSFGFKHGIPLDVDLVFDVRFLRNPHYDPELRSRDGRDAEVEKYVMADERTPCFLDRLYDLVGWSLPHYVSEGKAYLTVGIGCTGGRHRSVVVAERLARFVAERGYRVLVQHRDADQVAKR